MSRLLLDTHALVWAVGSPDHLSGVARTAIEDASVGLAVSAASAWELAIKVSAGRFSEAAPIVDEFTQVCARLGADLVAMDHRHALRAGTMRWDHQDPFDRMLAAQAIIDDMVLVTRDAAFASLPGLRTIW